VAPGFGRSSSTSGIWTLRESKIKSRLPSASFTWSFQSVDMRPLESDDRELLQVSGLQENQISNLLCLQLLLPGAMDLLTCGPVDGWSKFTSGLWHLWLQEFNASALQDFGHFGTSNTSATSRLRPLRHFRLRPFGTLGTSGLQVLWHFKIWPFEKFTHFSFQDS
jgi:hypothetical protein